MKKLNEMNILIVGLGLIGGSYAKALKKNGIIVSAIDINQNSIAYAIKEGFIDNKGLTNDELIKNSDLIICSLYPQDTVEWILENQEYYKDEVIITDTSGVKRAIVSQIHNKLYHGEFIASHPMAGRETSGVKNSLSNLFVEANFIITPTENNTYRSIELMEELGKNLKFKNIEILSVEEHDRLIGFLSQLTHAVAVSLMNSQETEHLIRYTGDSFRDLTRIAKINDKLWSELFLLNKDILSDEIDKFVIQLEQLKSKLDENDVDGLCELFQKSTIARKKFDK